MVRQYFGVNTRLEQFGLEQDSVVAENDGRWWKLGDTDETFSTPLEQGESLKEAIERLLHPSAKIVFFEEMETPPGSYFPRLYRPTFINEKVQEQTNESAMQIAQTRILYERLEGLFRHIHPKGENLAAYGHETRNLLILAATEAETMMKGILRANGVVGPKHSTNDYIKLLRPLRLDEYACQFAFHPWLGALSPFKGWSSHPSPTKTLSWYDAYNAVKHDRETAFHRASLQAAADAVMACQVLLLAQLGPQVLAIPVVAEQTPSWMPSEKYYDGASLTDRVNYPF